MTRRCEAKASAKERGDKTYMGSVCRFGHSGERFSSTGGCVDCLRGHAKRNQEKYRRAKGVPTRAERPTGVKARSAHDRIMEKVHMIPESGCWLFAGSSDPKGYGYIGVGSDRKVRAHRAMWAHANGDIPHGMFVCHKCDTPACVNPDHLFIGSALDNSRDMVRKGRARFRGNRLEAENAAH